MENPATWTQAEWVVQAAIRQAEKGRAEFRVGLSMTRQVTDALREAGLLPTDLPALGLFSPPGTVRTDVVLDTETGETFTLRTRPKPPDIPPF